MASARPNVASAMVSPVACGPLAIASVFSRICASHDCCATSLACHPNREAMGHPIACTTNAVINPATKILVLIGIFLRQGFFAGSFVGFFMDPGHSANALEISGCPTRYDLRNRSALDTTDSELKLMASAAIIG